MAKDKGIKSAVVKKVSAHWEKQIFI